MGGHLSQGLALVLVDGVQVVQTLDLKVRVHCYQNVGDISLQRKTIAETPCGDSLKSKLHNIRIKTLVT